MTEPDNKRRKELPVDESVSEYTFTHQPWATKPLGNDTVAMKATSSHMTEEPIVLRGQLPPGYEDLITDAEV